MLVKLIILAMLAAIRLNQIVALGQVTTSYQNGCNSTPSVQKAQLSWISFEQETSKFEPEEGECILQLTFKLTRLREEVTLALCNLGSPFAKSPFNVAKLVEYVSAWQQDEKYTECRLGGLSQELVVRQSNTKKLAMLLSHALNSVAMANFLDSELSGLVADISYLVSKIGSNFRFESLLSNLENSLMHVALATSVAEETHTMQQFASSFMFVIQREVTAGDHLQSVSANTASTQLMRSLCVGQNIEELAHHTKYQATQLRKMASLLQLVVTNSNTSSVAVVECLQSLKNSVNRKEQQIASLVLLISSVQNSLLGSNALLSNISKTSGAALCMLESRVTKFESYRNALLLFQRMMSQVLEHTLNVLINLESIQQIVRQYSIPEADSPFSRLEELNGAVQDVQEIIQNIRLPTSLQMEIKILTGMNHMLLTNISGMCTMVQDLKLQTGTHLTQHMDCLKTALESLVELKQNIISEELKSRTKEVHQQVEELSSSAMLLVMKTNNSSGTIRSIEEFTPLLINRIQAISNVTFEVDQVLEIIPLQFSDVRGYNLLVTEAIHSINVSFNDVASLLKATQASLEIGEEIVISVLKLLDQVSLPVQFSNDSILILNPDGVGLMSAGAMTTANSKFYSLSFTMRKMELSDCIIIQLTEIWQHKMDYHISVIVGVINGTVMASFIFSHPVGGVESVSLVISENTVPPNKPFLIEVSRTDRNVHLFVQDIESESVYCTSSSISRMMASFFRTTSVRSTSFSLGGAQSNIQNMPFSGVGNFTGCLSEILLNGEDIELWSLATSAHIDPPALQPCSSSDSTLRKLKISCDGSEYAQATILQGNLLPLEFIFSSFHPNGILMYAFSEDMASSIQVSLLYGHIVVKITSNGEQTKLTSLQTYTNGVNQFFSLSQSSSQDLHTLVLNTSLEETRTRLEFTETEAVLNHTNVFLCGVPNNFMNETGGISNFTGCTALSSRITLYPLPLNCLSSVQQRPCSYCLNEATYSVSFYGAGYASFAPVTVKDHFDIGFSFITSFPSGLLLHSGNSSRGLWFDVVLVNGQLQLLFGSPFGILSLPARTHPLNDLMRHSINFIVNTVSNIDILVDGSGAGSFPFGSFFPVGTLTPSLSVGGIDPVLEGIVLPGVTTEGFKGCIDSLHVIGRPVDFSKSEKAEQVNFKLRNGNQSVDSFRFDGEGYAQYDLGRFEPNFSLGLQLSTLIPSVLLLYIEDAFALQVVNGKVGLIIAGDETVESINVISNSSIVSDGFWHSVVMRKSGSHIQLLIDERSTAETNNAPKVIETDSDLFIGGIPRNGNVSLPGVIREGFIGEMRMAYLVHSVRSRGVQHTTLETA